MLFSYYVLFMKNIILLFVGVLLGLFLWANIGFRFTQDMSVQAVEDAFDQAYSGLQVSYSGSVADTMWDDFSQRLKENIAVKKDELKEEIKKSLWKKLFGGRAE